MMRLLTSIFIMSMAVQALVRDKDVTLLVLHPKSTAAEDLPIYG